MAMEYIVLVLLWIVWCSLHSGMISLRVIHFVKSMLGENFRFYRLLYNTIAFTTLAAVYNFGMKIESKVVFHIDGGWRIVQVLFFLVAMVLLIAGAKKYDLPSFAGIRQIRSGVTQVTLSEDGKLDTAGVLGFVRHPWYLATLIILWVRQQDLSLTSLITNSVLTIYLLVGTLLEERKLKKLFGQRYLDYMASVSMLFPLKWLQIKLTRGQKQR